ncbi:unnamed protein product [Adineta steineri]|uniref:Uncharacterized protein n=1 Tax=Adineta steineri TaxID=433720 RepID=A0A818IFW8_9BILA|nr:unnamed protein product [Adineta steineri]CAF1066254.1 unnamed protein product [Adineta steineri]CAF3521943.1 unnamed protein product [Adineta steineri]CAF4148041.1 unnamed protein product [Adineta steineri]
MGKKQSTLYVNVGPPITTSVYSPTILFGRILKLIWDKSPIWEISQSSIDIDDYLSILDGMKISSASSFDYSTINKIRLIDELPINQKYNFVLLGNGSLVFGKIPHRTLKYRYRLLSKHVVLAKRSSNVRFAGETLLMNNNSSTYRPDDKMVPDAVAYFQRLFPHLLVREISRH